MDVLSFSPYDDTGGVGYLMAEAFGRLKPDWSYASVVGNPSYLQYPRRTPWEWGDVLARWSRAHVVHLHDGFHQIPNHPAKRHVVTYHGTGFREAPGACLKQCRQVGAIALVATLDLWLIAPEDVTWMPAPFDLDALARIRQEHFVPHETLRICHAPTWRNLKSTDRFLEACERLGRETPVEVVLVEKQPWSECLKLKATCDVYFDQTLYHYGQNSIEAWAMGIPVVCGAAPRTIAEMKRRFPLPFIQTTEDTIYEALASLVDPGARANMSALGLAHVQRFHSQQAGVDALTPIYERAAGA